MSKFSSTSLLQHGEDVIGEQTVQELSATGGDHLDRRKFLSGASLAASAIGVAALSGCSEGNNTGQLTSTPTGTAPSVADILNFALNLEYLEATFYLTLTTGSGLPTSLMGTNPGAVTNSPGKVTFTDPGVQDVANQLAADELGHVTFLRATMQSLGITPVDMPALNLGALNSGSGAITGDYQFLDYARQLETVGVSAYAGAASGLISNPVALTYAAQILDTESQHEAVLRQLCTLNNVYSSAVDSGDYAPAPQGTQVFNTDPVSGLYLARNTSQVLQIVYASNTNGTTSGGFFPNGLNGNIKTV